jgi:hypothetical protein
VLTTTKSGPGVITAARKIACTSRISERCSMAVWRRNYRRPWPITVAEPRVFRSS